MVAKHTNGNGKHPFHPRPTAKPRVQVGDRAASRAAGILATRGRRRHEPFVVDQAKLHPPGIRPESTLAMDSAFNNVTAWAQDNYAMALNGAFAEGQEFLGYPYLAVLAQRPEYRTIVETLATESMRKGYKLEVEEGAEDEEGDGETDEAGREREDKRRRIKLLNEHLDGEWHVREHLKAVSALDGYFGRGHLYIDTGDTDDREELLTSIGDGRNAVSRLKIKRDMRIRLQTVEPVWCYPQDYNSSNPLKPDWFRPQTWTSMADRVHVTRLLPFVAHPVSDLLKPSYSFGGLSMVQMAKPYVDNWLRNRQSASDILNAYSVMVLLTDLSASLAGDGEEMFKRAQVFNALRQNNGLFMADKEAEEFKNVSAPLGTVDQLVAQSQEHLCSVSKTPTVKLLGVQPAGLNADSEGVLRAYDDSVHSYQEAFYRPHLSTLVGMAQLVLFGEVDPAIKITFPRLREMDEKERAEINKINAETDVILIDGNVLHPEESRKRVAGDADTPYPGLDVDDVPEPPEMPDMEGESGGELQPSKVKSSINVAGGDEVAKDELVERLKEQGVWEGLERWKREWILDRGLE